MKLHFNLNNVDRAEFGVGFDDDSGRSCAYVPVEVSVQEALCKMALGTWDAMEGKSDPLRQYNPAEKHNDNDRLFLPLNDEMGKFLRSLHEAEHFDSDAHALEEPDDIFCYFARMTDDEGRRLTALRRAAHFKGVLKNHLLHWLNDSLKLVEDNVFKLDADFDMLIDKDNIHILRPSSFEFVAQLKSVVLAAVPKNIQLIQKDIKFVDFDGIAKYAVNHARAARYLASIRRLIEEEGGGINKAKLKKRCEDMGVKIEDDSGKITVVDGNELEFLQILDGRLYQVDIMTGEAQTYLAASRKLLGNKSGGGQ